MSQDYYSSPQYALKGENKAFKLDSASWHLEVQILT